MRGLPVTLAAGVRPRAKLSDRVLFVRALLVGLILALPGWARAAGQWCNDKVVTHRATLTLRAATVSGRPVTVPTGAVYDVTSSPYEPDWVNAHLFCSACTAQLRELDYLRKQP